MKPAQLFTIALAALLGFLAVPGFAEVPEEHRALITDPAQLESMGFPFDARNVYGRTVAGHSPEVTRDFGPTLAHYSGVPGAAFIGRENIAGSWQYSAANGDLDRRGSEEFANAQVIMPTGVVLSGFRWWANDSHATANLAVFLFEMCLPDFGAGAPTFTVIGSADPATSGSSGNQSAFVSIPAHTVDNVGCTYIARVRFGALASPATGATLNFQKFRAAWQRQVSPAPGSATFGDVPTGHIFFQFVEALAASGITTGCNTLPPLYCPDDPVTRGQMAVFISKALGLTFP